MATFIKYTATISLISYVLFSIALKAVDSVEAQGKMAVQAKKDRIEAIIEG